MYQEYPYFIREGWLCPRCKIILNPSTNFCPYCGMKEKTFTTTSTSAKPEWIYKENTSTGRVIDDWWNHPTSISWEDMIRGSGLLEDD